MAKIVILNGAPGVGKDTLANALFDMNRCDYIKSFKEPMFDMAQCMLGPSRTREFMELYNDRSSKEKPVLWLSGLSPRAFMIYISEQCVKPILGNKQFGRLVAESIGYSDDVVVMSDGGFADEIVALADYSVGSMGKVRHDIHLVRLYRDGFTFEGDSRSHIYLKDCFSNITEYDVVLEDGKISQACDYIIWECDLRDRSSL